MAADDVVVKITAVITQPRWRAWACGTTRAEIARSTSREWRWRVWPVLGEVTLAEGRERGLRRAQAKALTTLLALGWCEGVVADAEAGR